MFCNIIGTRRDAIYCVRVARPLDLRSSAMNCDAVIYVGAINHIRPAVMRGRNLLRPYLTSDLAKVFQNIFYMIDV